MDLLTYSKKGKVNKTVIENKTPDICHTTFFIQKSDIFQFVLFSILKSEVYRMKALRKIFPPAIVGHTFEAQPALIADTESLWEQKSSHSS